MRRPAADCRPRLLPQGQRYSYPYGAGLLTLMPMVGSPPTAEVIGRWAESLSLSSVRLEKDWMFFEKALKNIQDARAMMMEMQAASPACTLPLLLQCPARPPRLAPCTPMAAAPSAPPPGLLPSASARRSCSPSSAACEPSAVAPPAPPRCATPLSLPCAAPLHSPFPRRAHRLAPHSPHQASAKRKEAKALQEKAEKAAKAAAEAEAEPEAAAAE